MTYPEGYHREALHNDYPVPVEKKEAEFFENYLCFTIPLESPSYIVSYYVYTFNIIRSLNMVLTRMYKVLSKLKRIG